MTLKICKCCGQLIPPALLFPNCPRRQRVYDFIARHPEGVSAQQVLDNVYADDVNGGPDSGNKVVHVFVWYINKVLKSKGLKISTSFGPSAVYTLSAL
jgi:hypothetical protein